MYLFDECRLLLAPQPMALPVAVDTDKLNSDLASVLGGNAGPGPLFASGAQATGATDGGAASGSDGAAVASSDEATASSTAPSAASSLASHAHVTNRSFNLDHPAFAEVRHNRPLSQRYRSFFDATVRAAQCRSAAAAHAASAHAAGGRGPSGQDPAATAEKEEEATEATEAAEAELRFRGKAGRGFWAQARRVTASTFARLCDDRRRFFTTPNTCVPASHTHVCTGSMRTCRTHRTHRTHKPKGTNTWPAPDLETAGAAPALLE